MVVFPSDEWVQAWVALCNRSPEFEASGANWEGAVAVVVEADAQLGIPSPIIIRLEGRHGKWLQYAVGTDSRLAEETVFVLRAPYDRWKQVIMQELHPIKGVLQGKIVIEGHLPTILRWTRSLPVLTALAARIETDYLERRA